MQTFLPWPDFEKTAACLDRQRLGKQRVETLMIARIFAGQPSSWKNHPAVVMWRGHALHLLRYQEAICYEWTNVRGYSDNCLEETDELLTEVITCAQESRYQPWWLGDEDFHLSHRAALHKKDPVHYAAFEDLDIGYRWPERERGVWRG